MLRNTLPYTPVGVHLAIVDPQVGTERRAVGLRTADGRLLVGPDNGLLSLAWERCGGAVALGDRTAIVVEVPLPTFAERRAAWALHTGVDDVDDVAAKFRLSMAPDRRRRGGRPHTRRRRGRGAPAARAPRPRGAARLQRAPRRAGGAPRPGFGWDQLVLPERPLEILHSISAYLRHRDLVLSEWGYGRTVARTQGLKTLFAGESGTGKTMAAQVLAARPRAWSSSGSTWRPWSRSTSGRPRRTSTASSPPPRAPTRSCSSTRPTRSSASAPRCSDSHDRYANIEVAYLLQKMEGYAGAVILATNFRHNIDEAFLRRLDFVIDFPFPEPEDRERIWRLVLPAEAPVGRRRRRRLPRRRSSSCPAATSATPPWRRPSSPPRTAA